MYTNDERLLDTNENRFRIQMKRDLWIQMKRD